MLSHLKREVPTLFANVLRRLPFIALLSLAMLGMALAATASGPLSSGYNPDQPRFSNIDESMYLQLRDEHLALLRGIPYPQPDVRVHAIQQYQQQQRQARPLLPSSNPAWTPLGPSPLPNGQTQQFPAVTPVSGRATAIAVDPTNQNKVYLGTAQGGVWRSLDGGLTWTSIFDTAASQSIGAIALAPSDPNILYVGTGEPNNSCDSYFGVGLYRIDSAATSPSLVGPINPPFPFFTGAVTLTTTVFTGRAISAIAVHPSDPATIFVSTAAAIAGVGCNALSNTIPPLALRGVYRSTNATSAPGTVAFTKLFVTTQGSLDSPGTGNTSITDMVMEPGNPNNLLVGVSGVSAPGGGVFRSTNALAATPTFAQTLTPGFTGLWHRLAISKIGSDVTVYVSSNEPSGVPACSSVGQAGRVRRSNNAGATWSAPLPAAEGFCGGQCAYDNPIGADPNITTTVYLGGNARGTCSDVMKKSSDGGVTFTRDDTGLHADSHSIAFTTGISPSLVFFATDGGIWKRDASLAAAAPWTNLNNASLNTLQFQSLAVHPTDRNFTIGGTQDNGTEGQTISPGNWLSAESGDGGFALIDQSAANTVNVTMYHTFFNQRNNLIGFDRAKLGACLAVKDSWEWRGAGVAVDPTPSCDGDAFAANNGINLADQVLFYAPMALGPGTPNTLYFGTNKLYRSIDRGDTMSVVSQNPISVTGVTTSPVSAVGIAPQDDNYRIVGLQNGGVYGTSTGASTLVNINSPSFPANPTGSTTNRFVARAVIDPNNKDVAYVTFSFFAPAGQGVWKITNFGAATNLAPVAPVWSAVGNGIPSVPINAFAVDPNNSNMLFAGTDIGVYFSPDAGANWYPYGTGLPVVAVFDMAIQNSFRVLRIATHGRGMWETSMPNAPTAVTVDSLSARAQTGDALAFQMADVLPVLFVGAGALTLLAVGAFAVYRTRRAVK